MPINVLRQLGAGPPANTPNPSTPRCTALHCAATLCALLCCATLRTSMVSSMSRCTKMRLSRSESEIRSTARSSSHTEFQTSENTSQRAMLSSLK